MTELCGSDEANEWEFVGLLPVDSGMMMIVDPQYIKPDFDTDGYAKPGLNYAGACEAALSDEGHGEFGDGAAFCVYSGSGQKAVFQRRSACGDLETRIVHTDVGHLMKVIYPV